MKGRRKIPPRVPSEEFSIEFGDVNGIKLYEVPHMSNTRKKQNNQKGQK
jgi:hypothetical protein